MRKPISGKMLAFLVVLTILVFPLLVVFSIAALVMFIARYIIAFTVLCLFNDKSPVEAHQWIMDVPEVHNDTRASTN